MSVIKIFMAAIAGLFLGRFVLDKTETVPVVLVPDVPDVPDDDEEDEDRDLSDILFDSYSPIDTDDWEEIKRHQLKEDAERVALTREKFEAASNALEKSRKEALEKAMSGFEIISHETKRDERLIHHSAIVFSKDKPEVGKVSIKCGYHPLGYGIIGAFSIDKVDLEKDLWKVIWTTLSSCD